MEQPYPFANKTRQYESLGISALEYALQDAKEAQVHADALAEAGFKYVDKGPSWRADDVIVIATVLHNKNKRLKKTLDTLSQ